MMTILFDEAEARGERNRLLQMIRKKIARNKSFEQIVEECESTADEIRPLYDSALAEMDEQRS